MKKFAVDFKNKEIVVSAKYLRRSGVVDTPEGRRSPCGS